MSGSAKDDEKDPLGILEDRSPAELYDPGEEERALASQLQLKFREAYKHRLTWERQWEINWLYQRGEQPIRNLTTGDVFRLPQDDRQQLISGNNVLRPTSRSLLAKLTKNIPTCVVVPPSTDLDDLHGSQVADSLLQYIRRKEKLDIKYIDAYRSVVTFGTGYLKLSWDREAGRTVGICAECGYRGKEEEVDGECPTCRDTLTAQHQEETAQIQGQVGVETAAMPGEPPPQVELPEPPEIPLLEADKEGDVRVECLDPREVFIDPSACTLDEAQWWCHRVALPVSVVRARFSKMAKYIDKEGGITSDQYVTLVRGTTTYRAASRQLADHIYLHEFHERPTEDHPDGRIIWMANGIILEEIANPYKKLGRFPLYCFFWEKNAGEFYGESYIEQASPIQRELNILLTQTRENRELNNNPQWWAPANCGIAIEEMDTTAGRIHRYNPMSKRPEASQIPALAQYTYTEIERMEGAIRAQASISEQEAGSFSGETSGRYAAILESQAALQVGPILRYNNSEWVECARGMVILTQEFYTDDRVWTTYGSDRPKTHEFKKLNPGWDMDMQEDDSLSTNNAVKLNQVTEMANGPVTGQIFMKDGKLDVKKFARKSGLKLNDVTPETSSADHAYAAAIPSLIEDGHPYTPREWDDPEVFAEELEAWLKGPGRNDATPPQLVEQVANLYRFYLQRTQAAIMQQQQGMPGAPPGAGAPGGAPPPSGAPATGAAPSAVPEAQQIASAADDAGEATSRTQAAHEG